MPTNDDIPFTEEEIEATASSVSSRGANSEHDASAGCAASNTAPQSCNPCGFLPLRQGIDSLYLTYKGDLKDAPSKNLEKLKKVAQSETDKYRAQYPTNEHIFNVWDRGRAHYHYVLSDGSFEISLNAKVAPVKPVAEVRVSSRFLSAINNYNTLEPTLNSLVGEFCDLGAHTVSRADFYLDFCCDDSIIRNINQEHFITRAEVIRPYFTNHLLSAWDIGLGADISARIYNKTLEIQKSSKGYLKELWKQAGWDGERTVWRIEFQLRRSILAQYNIKSLSDLLQNRERLWTYCTQNWLQLKIPKEGDNTRSRWPVHPLWQVIWLAGCCLPDLPPLQRRKPQHDNMPDEGRIVRQLISPLASLFSIHGITDLRVGRRMLYENFPYLLKNHKTEKGIRLDDYLILKIKERNREYSIFLNDDYLFDISNFDFTFPQDLEEEDDDDENP